MRFVDDSIIDTTSIVADFQSEVLHIETILHLSMQITWTSVTADATITLQVSNDGENWVNTNQTATISNNSSSVMLVLIDNSFSKCRVKVDYNSGTIDTLKAVYSGKGF